MDLWLILGCKQVDEVIDAQRNGTGELVAIKVTYNDSQELKITQFLSSMHDPQNHCVPILQVLPDPYDSKISLMVLPYLRPCNNPELQTIGEAIDFVDQSLEVSSTYVRGRQPLTVFTNRRV